LVSILDFNWRGLSAVWCCLHFICWSVWIIKPYDTRQNFLNYTNKIKRGLNYRIILILSFVCVCIICTRGCYHTWGVYTLIFGSNGTIQVEIYFWNLKERNYQDLKSGRNICYYHFDCYRFIGGGWTNIICTFLRYLVPTFGFVAIMLKPFAIDELIEALNIFYFYHCVRL
jgi:hypothetical protein